MPNNKPIIKIKNATIKSNVGGYEKTTLNDLSFDILSNEFLAIVGKSTSGKSLLARLMTDDFEINSYASNGSAMYFPSEKNNDQVVPNKKHAHIMHPVDLINIHKSLLKSPPCKMFQNERFSIIEKATVKLRHFRSLVAIAQYKEAKLQQAERSAIYKKAKKMKKHDESFFITNEFAKNKTSSINNNTSPSVPVILDLLEKMRHEEENIAKEYLLLSASSRSSEKPHWAAIKKSNSNIKKHKHLISNIQVFIAKNNFEFIKALKNDIKFLACHQFKTEIGVSQKSIKKIHEYNEILKISNDPSMLNLIERIREQQEIIDKANFELDNYYRIEHNRKALFKKIVHALKQNQNDLSLMDMDNVQSTLAFLNSQRTLDQLELDLKVILEKISSNKKIDQYTIESFLENWSYKTQSHFNNSKISKKTKKLLANTVVKVDQDPMFNLKPNVKFGKQIAKAISTTEKIGGKNLKAKVIEWMYEFGIENPEEVYYSTPLNCSSLTKKLVSFAVALAYEPKVLILDEAFVDLGPVLQKQILTLIMHLKDKLQFTIIMITNNLGIIHEYADRIAVVHKGKIVEFGNKNEIIEKPLHCATRKAVKSLNNIMESLQATESNNLFNILEHKYSKQNSDNNFNAKSSCNCAQRLEEFSKSHFAMVPKKTQNKVVN